MICDGRGALQQREEQKLSGRVGHLGDVKDDEVAMRCPESLSNQISKKRRLETNAVVNGVKEQGRRTN